MAEITNCPTKSILCLFHNKKLTLDHSCIVRDYISWLPLQLGMPCTWSIPMECTEGISVTFHLLMRKFLTLGNHPFLLPVAWEDEDQDDLGNHTSRLESSYQPGPLKDRVDRFGYQSGTSLGLLWETEISFLKWLIICWCLVTANWWEFAKRKWVFGSKPRPLLQYSTMIKIIDFGIRLPGFHTGLLHLLVPTY